MNTGNKLKEYLRKNNIPVSETQRTTLEKYTNDLHTSEPHPELERFNLGHIKMENQPEPEVVPDIDVTITEDDINEPDDGCDDMSYDDVDTHVLIDDDLIDTFTHVEDDVVELDTTDEPEQDELVFAVTDVTEDTLVDHANFMLQSILNEVTASATTIITKYMDTVASIEELYRAEDEFICDILHKAASIIVTRNDDHTILDSHIDSLSVLIAEYDIQEEPVTEDIVPEEEPQGTLLSSCIATQTHLDFFISSLEHILPQHHEPITTCEQVVELINECGEYTINDVPELSTLISYIRQIRANFIIYAYVTTDNNLTAEDAIFSSIDYLRNTKGENILESAAQLYEEVVVIDELDATMPIAYSNWEDEYLTKVEQKMQNRSHTNLAKQMVNSGAVYGQMGERRLSELLLFMTTISPFETTLESHEPEHVIRHISETLSKLLSGSDVSTEYDHLTAVQMFLFAFDNECDIPTKFITILKTFLGKRIPDDEVEANSGRILLKLNTDDVSMEDNHTDSPSEDDVAMADEDEELPTVEDDTSVDDNVMTDETEDLMEDVVDEPTEPDDTADIHYDSDDDDSAVVDTSTLDADIADTTTTKAEIINRIANIQRIAKLKGEPSST